MDTLSIKNLSVATHIGVYEWEQRIRQQLLIDISIPLECDQCKDDIEHTIDYEVLCNTITQHIESQAFKLIETVAVSISKLLQEQFQVVSATISVCKPHAVANAQVIQVTRSF